MSGGKITIETEEILKLSLQNCMKDILKPRKKGRFSRKNAIYQS